MIEPKKIIYMTKAAACQAKEGKNELKVSEYSQVDYVLIQLLKSFFSGTVAFGAMCVIWLMASWESLNKIFYQADYIGFAKSTIRTYMIFMIIYLIIVGIVSLLYHRKCMKRRKRLLSLLERI